MRIQNSDTKILLLEIGLQTALFQGDTKQVDENTTAVYNPDGVKIQEIKVVDGQRSAAIKTHSFVWMGQEPSLATHQYLLETPGEETLSQKSIILGGRNG